MNITLERKIGYFKIISTDQLTHKRWKITHIFDIRTLFLLRLKSKFYYGKNS